MMETKSTKVSGKKPADIISNLPEELIGAILMCLPLRDAVRTSILSKKWRYEWTYLRKLTLDHTLWKETKQNISTPRIKFAVILYQLLSLLEGPIQLCKISIPDLKDCPEIDTLLLFLSRNQVESINLELPKGEKYKLPSSVFKCSKLRHLALQYCLIIPPPAFDGFSLLIGLEFLKVTISVKSLENLISSCPLLMHLVLEILAPLNHIEVNAPQLRYFYFGSKVNSVCFKNTTLLARVQIAMHEDAFDIGSFVEGGKCNSVEFFDSLPAVEELHLDDSIIQSLITGLGKLPVRLPKFLLCLRRLTLCCICLSELDEINYLLCMLKSSPYLEEIEVEAYYVKGDELPAQKFLEAEFYSDIKLNKLIKVTLMEITGRKSEIELIKLLLAKSPVLEKLLIDPPKLLSTQTSSDIMKQVTKFERASPRAEVILVD